MVLSDIHVVHVQGQCSARGSEDAISSFLYVGRVSEPA